MNINTKKLFIYSLIESIYLLYMFSLFKTTIYFDNPIELYLQRTYFNNNTTMIHPIKNSEYSNKICKFGKICSILLVLLIYARYISIYNNNSISNILYYTKIVLIIVALFSFILNMNALIYLIPILIYEIYLSIHNYKI